MVGGAGNNILGRRVLVNSRRAFGLPPVVLPLELEPPPPHAARRAPPRKTDTASTAHDLMRIPPSERDWPSERRPLASRRALRVADVNPGVRSNPRAAAARTFRGRGEGQGTPPLPPGGSRVTLVHSTQRGLLIHGR